MQINSARGCVALIIPAGESVGNQGLTWGTPASLLAIWERQHPCWQSENASIPAGNLGNASILAGNLGTPASLLASTMQGAAPLRANARATDSV
jgi:hypothetical protein